MSEADEIDRLDARITALEKNWLEEIRAIRTQLGALSVAVAGKRECPDPGACMHLRPIVDQNTKDIMNLRLWQAGMMAVILCLGFVIAPLFTILGPAIRVKLGLP